MVVYAETNIKPNELLKLLKDLEEKIGRTHHSVMAQG